MDNNEWSVLIGKIADLIEENEKLKSDNYWFEKWQEVSKELKELTLQLGGENNVQNTLEKDSI